MLNENLWRNVDTSPPWRPNWSDRRFHEVGRSYPTLYKVTQSDGNVRICSVDVFPTFLVLMGLLLALGTAAISFFIAHSTNKTLLLVLFLFSVTAGSIAAILIRRYVGVPKDYLLVDRGMGTMTLPRYSLTVPLDSLIGFQWIEGRGKLSFFGGDTVNAADFNLLVISGTEILRFHILAMPRRVDMMLLAASVNLPIYVIHCRTAGLFRYMDRETV